jgi:hypothetical protein
LQVDGTNFSTPICHSSLSPVELPPWLPRDILEKMVTKYKSHLRVQVAKMLKYHRSPDVSSEIMAIGSRVQPEEKWDWASDLDSK